MKWTKHNETAYQFSNPAYYLYHTERHLFCKAGNLGNWHIIFWPEPGNGTTTVLGKQMTDIPEENALIWAEEVITKHQ